MRISIVEKKTDLHGYYKMLLNNAFRSLVSIIRNQHIGHSEIIRAFYLQLNLDHSDHKF